MRNNFLKKHGFCSQTDLGFKFTSATYELCDLGQVHNPSVQERQFSLSV